MAILPPVVQEFSINAEAYLAGIDDMIEQTGKLGDAIDEVVASMGGLSGNTPGVTGADSELADAMDRAAGAALAQADAMEALAGRLDDVQGAIDANTIAVDENSAAIDGYAGKTDAAGDAAVGFGSKAKLAFLGVAAGVVYAVAKASDFQSKLTLLGTEAGVSTKQLAGLGHGVLELAGQVGQSPDSLVGALYHVESAFHSTGISGSKALSLLKTAAEGASVGHADLTDVTNALDATIVGGVPGVKNYSQAMGALNAIVGSGDMTMQNLADAMGTGAIANAKLYGQNIDQVGAALAVFGDNNIRGAKAATDLRMTWQAIEAPLTTAKPLLNSIGLQYNTLANTMEHHGLSTAIGQFISHLKASKVPIADWGQYVTEIFGKRAGSGIGLLIDQYGRLQSKLPAIEKGAHNFGNAWDQTNKTLGQQWQNFRGALDALVISFGEKLLPAATKVVGELAKFLEWMEKHPELAAFAGAALAVAGAMKLISVGTTAMNAAMSANPIGLVLIAVIALAAGLYELYKHSKTVRDAVADVARFFEGAWKDAVRIAGDVVHWFVTGPLAFIRQQLAAFRAFWSAEHQEIERIVRVVWDIMAAYIKASWAIIHGVIMAGVNAVEMVWKAAWVIIYNVVKTAWDVIATVVRSSIREVLDVISIILDLLQGKWGAAWDKLKDLVSTVLHEIQSVTRSILSGFVNIMVGLGKDLIQGFINGIKDMFGTAFSVVKDLAGGVVNTLKSALKIFSPSQVMHEIGLQTGQGLINGLTGTASDVNSASKSLSDSIEQAFNGGLVGYGTADALTNWVASNNTKLQSLANQRQTILNTIKTAQSFATTTASNAVSNASLTNVVSGMNGGVVTSYGLVSGLQSDLTQINQFSSAIKKLGQLGLNKNLLNQIIQAGPAQGLPIAQALINGPLGNIQTLNKTENSISSAATSLGDTAANAMYDSGADAGKGFLSGLQDQQAAIEAEMKKMADSMVSRIRSDLGIHSPSTVFHEHGLAVAMGLASGMDDGRPLVEAAAHRLSAATGLALSGSGGGSGGGGDVHYNVQFQITVPGGFVGSDAQFVAQLAPVVQKSILQLEKRNPTAQTTLPH